ncbi:helix-turn-helix domain-containing protein [Thermoleptolyngbya sp. C42_A2020_037]|uniref:nSTAND1 domain-containing NTPase n=1 Tax=Thermoleptolyngbya sp. C42_A2020_037 TaxID=2747799 RepID=UPI0019EA9090|nr:helix-turn-helix domain-containing protein [Thermoleptolyngbya sp. C42_A2020_037]MBF2087267.1 AAA family ATPase [Thermoleptolyngbya sp. C42_A2020_037]
MKEYFYQIDPAIYRTEPGLQPILRTLQLPPYRNLYCMVPILSLCFGLGLGLPLMGLAGWYLHHSIDVVWGIDGAIAGASIGTLFLILFLGVFGTAVSIARGLVAGTVVGVASGIMNSILFCVVLGLSQSLPWPNADTQSDIIATFALSFGLAIGVIVGITIGGFAGNIVGLALGSTGSLVVSIVFSVLVSASSAVDLAAEQTGILFGFVFGLVAIATGGAAVSLVKGIFSSVIISAAVGVAVGFSSTPAVGLLTGAIAVSCSLRLPFYVMELIWAGCCPQNRHPAEWDELLIIYIPGLQRRLFRQIQQDFYSGMMQLCYLARNPFQRWVAQSVLKRYLSQHPAPLHALHSLLTLPASDAYIFSPISHAGWRHLPAINHVLLGELHNRWVNCAVDPSSRLFEHLVYQLTRRFRDRKQTPVTEWARLLFQLQTADISQQKLSSQQLAEARAIAAQLASYPGGADVGQFFDAIDMFLRGDRLSSLVKIVSDASLPLPSVDNALNPPVAERLHQLQAIATDLHTSGSTSRVSQQSALLRAANALKLLEEGLEAWVITPERVILRQVIHHWQHLVCVASGEIGNAQPIQPIANPYVIGNPVTGSVFVGREDIMRRFEELWLPGQQVPSVVLYGQRRMGKSSILHNLKAILGDRAVIVDFNLQVMGIVNSTHELLYALAIEMYDSLPQPLPDTVQEPQLAQFTQHNPYQSFLRFLKRLDAVRASRRFIITVDEFELLEHLIETHVIEQRLVAFWRGLIQSYPWFVMVFAGLHTLDEMRQDYWCPLFSSVMAIPVGLLSFSAVRQLVTQPSLDFELEYDPAAVQQIFALTSGQPYLVQLLGHTLVTYFNRVVFEQGVSRDKRLTLQDLERVVHSASFYRDSDAYFMGIWQQAENSQPVGQSQVLRCLGDRPLSISELSDKTDLSVSTLQSILSALQKRGIVVNTNGRYTYAVELMRGWVKRLDLPSRSESPI